MLDKLLLLLWRLLLWGQLLVADMEVMVEVELQHQVLPVGKPNLTLTLTKVYITVL